MTAMLEAPRELVQSFADWRLPAKTDARSSNFINRGKPNFATVTG